MTSTEESRLAVVETEVRNLGREVGEVKTSQRRMEAKLDQALETKADCTDVEALRSDTKEIRGWLWGLIVAVLIALLGAAGSLVLVLVQALVGN